MAGLGLLYAPALLHALIHPECVEKLFGKSEWVPDQVAEGLQKHP